MYFKLFVCLFAYASVADAAAASFINKCKVGDHKCAKESTAAAIPIFAGGIPELKVKPLDPIHYDELDASSQSLKLILRNIDVTGLKNCKAVKVERDAVNSKLTVVLLCTVNLDGQYEMDGRILILPIKGKGKLHAVLRQIEITVDANLTDKIGKDGKVFWDIVSWKYTYDLKAKSELVLENLFEGNEALSAAVKQLLAATPNEVVREVAPPIIKALLTKVVKVVDRFLREVPVEELVSA